jgi:hypothetical protein
MTAPKFTGPATTVWGVKQWWSGNWQGRTLALGETPARGHCQHAGYGKMSESELRTAWLEGGM